MKIVLLQSYMFLLVGANYYYKNYDNSALNLNYKYRKKTHLSLKIITISKNNLTT